MNKSTKTALTLLNNALKLTVTNGDCLSEREIDIMQTMAIFHGENKEYEKSMLKAIVSALIFVISVVIIEYLQLKSNTFEKFITGKLKVFTITYF